MIETERCQFRPNPQPQQSQRYNWNEMKSTRTTNGPLSRRNHSRWCPPRSWSMTMTMTTATTIMCMIILRMIEDTPYQWVSGSSSSGSTTGTTSSLPRSPPNQRRRYTQHENDVDGMFTQYHQHHVVDDHPPWNPSSCINSTTGLLNDIYQRIPGEWEQEYRLKSTRNTLISESNQYCRIRQVPGDGNCLFHSISVGLNYLVNQTHYDLSNTAAIVAQNTIDDDDQDDDDDDDDHSDDRGYSMSGRSTTFTRTSATTRRRRKRKSPTLDDLYIHSQYLREECVKYLRSTLQHSENDHPHSPRQWWQRWGSTFQNHPHQHPLYVQGREYIHSPELIHAAAQQYNISDVEYCTTMAEDCVWGGGPEIVVLCNILQRPIHVYELITSTSTTTKEEPSEAPPRSIYGRWTSQPHLSRPPSPAFVLRRMACFGSPKYDHKAAIHILSADSRFPDLRPGQQLSAGNHFLAVFPMDEQELNNDDDDNAGLGDQRRRRKRIRGGDSSNENDERWNHASTIQNREIDATPHFVPLNIVRQLLTKYMEWWKDLFQ